MNANIQQLGSSESAKTLAKSHKGGVTYTDSAVSLTAITKVKQGDMMSFDVQASRNCQVRAFRFINAVISYKFE